MPTYEFSCVSCGPFERWRDHRASGRETTCPNCGAAARRVYSAPRVNVTSKAGAELRRREERSAQPGLGYRSSPGDPAPKPRGGGGRPWQIGH